MKLKIEKLANGTVAVEITSAGTKKPITRIFSPEALRAVMQLFDVALGAKNFSMTWEETDSKDAL